MNILKILWRISQVQHEIIESKSWLSNFISLLNVRSIFFSIIFVSMHFCHWNFGIKSQMKVMKTLSDSRTNFSFFFCKLLLQTWINCLLNFSRYLISTFFNSISWMIARSRSDLKQGIGQASRGMYAISKSSSGVQAQQSWILSRNLIRLERLRNFIQ